MSKILELYSELLATSKRGDGTERFINDTFYGEEYNEVFPKLTILDIGSYQGDFSFACLPFAKIIYAFEPDPRPFEVLKKLVDQFEVGNIIKYSNSAIGGVSGNRTFGATGFGGSRLVTEAEAQNSPETTVVLVKTITLPQLFKDQDIDEVDILKIDIEDGEAEVFNSPEFAKISKKIKLIVGEHLAGSDAALKALGYEPRQINNNTIYERKT